MARNERRRPAGQVTATHGWLPSKAACPYLHKQGLQWQRAMRPLLMLVAPPGRFWSGERAGSGGLARTTAAARRRTPSPPPFDLICFADRPPACAGGPAPCGPGVLPALAGPGVSPSRPRAKNAPAPAAGPLLGMTRVMPVNARRGSPRTQTLLPCLMSRGTYLCPALYASCRCCSSHAPLRSAPPHHTTRCRSICHQCMAA